MKLFLFLPILAFLFSCGNVKKANKDTVKVDASTIVIDEEAQVKTPPEGKPQRNAMVKSTIGSFKESDAFSIQDAQIKGNTLLLTITYGGGCAEHKFEFIGSPMIMKSMPPIRSVQLIHDSANDNCKAIVTRIVEIDLKNIAYTPKPGSELMLMLKGWDKKIKYTYE